MPSWFIYQFAQTQPLKQFMDNPIQIWTTEIVKKQQNFMTL